ncbi:hypothetical protein XENOCAPTIV_000676, partial [Xenoophorus captivus]
NNGGPCNGRGKFTGETACRNWNWVIPSGEGRPKDYCRFFSGLRLIALDELHLQGGAAGSDTPSPAADYRKPSGGHCKTGT